MTDRSAGNPAPRATTANKINTSDDQDAGNPAPLSPEEMQAAVIAAAERGIESLRQTRKARRLLRRMALTLRVRDGVSCTVVDPYSNSVPLGAPHNAPIEEVTAWISRQRVQQ